MNIEDLDFPYPERLIATERQSPTRVMRVHGSEAPRELSTNQLLEELNTGDVLVVNDTRVLKRRLFTESNLEILFLKPHESSLEWSVLCPSSRWKQGVLQTLPEGVKLEIISRGRTQVVRADRELTEDYFERNGEMPLPPYIQKARGERHNTESDSANYQTGWARRNGSLAAPTASLHFEETDLEALRARGVHVVHITLHVGLGTFLPVTAPTLDEHVMHAEVVEIPETAWSRIENARSSGHRVWALGTTVARSLESAAAGKLERTPAGFRGETDLFIRPGFEWKVVDALLTNFHQPRSTLLALVASFAGLEQVRRTYSWAIENEFRLFSYGDLTAWTR